MADDRKNEGEGNKSADRDYREDTKDFVESGKVDEAAEKAKQDYEQNKDALEQAEEEAKKGPDT